MRIGYARVHARDHSPDAQHAALEAAGCQRIFLDRTHGALASRPELADALLAARPGDALVVTALDRLAASTRHLIALAGDLQTREVHLMVLDQGIDTSTPAGHAFFHTLEAIAAFQHALMSESTRAGLQAARARGRTGGQKPKLTPHQARVAQQTYHAGQHTVAQIAEEFGVSRPTIYRCLNRLADSAT